MFILCIVLLLIIFIILYEEISYNKILKEKYRNKKDITNRDNYVNSNSCIFVGILVVFTLLLFIFIFIYI